jgi:hypothetical protein
MFLTHVNFFKGSFFLKGIRVFKKYEFVYWV